MDDLLALTFVAYNLTVILMSMATPSVRVVIGLSYVLFMGGAAYDQAKIGPPQDASETAITQMVDTTSVLNQCND